MSKKKGSKSGSRKGQGESKDKDTAPSPQQPFAPPSGGQVPPTATGGPSQTAPKPPPPQDNQAVLAAVLKNKRQNIEPSELESGSMSGIISEQPAPPPPPPPPKAPSGPPVPEQKQVIQSLSTAVDKWKKEDSGPPPLSSQDGKPLPPIMSVKGRKSAFERKIDQEKSQSAGAAFPQGGKPSQPRTQQDAASVKLVQAPSPVPQPRPSGGGSRFPPVQTTGLARPIMSTPRPAGPFPTRPYFVGPSRPRQQQQQPRPPQPDQIGLPPADWRKPHRLGAGGPPLGQSRPPRTQQVPKTEASKLITELQAGHIAAAADLLRRQVIKDSGQILSDNLYDALSSKLEALVGTRVSHDAKRHTLSYALLLHLGLPSKEIEAEALLDRQAIDDAFKQEAQAGLCRELRSIILLELQWQMAGKRPQEPSAIRERYQIAGQLVRCQVGEKLDFNKLGFMRRVIEMNIQTALSNLVHEGLEDLDPCSYDDDPFSEDIIESVYDLARDDDADVIIPRRHPGLGLLRRIQADGSFPKPGPPNMVYKLTEEEDEEEDEQGQDGEDTPEAAEKRLRKTLIGKYGLPP